MAKTHLTMNVNGDAVGGWSSRVWCRSTSSAGIPASPAPISEVLRETVDYPVRQSLRLERLLASFVLGTDKWRKGVGTFLERKAGAR